MIRGDKRYDGRAALVALFATAVVAALGPSVLHAQEVRQDPATGHYYVTAYNDAGQPVEILVERADLVEISVSPRIGRTAGGLPHYTYEVAVLASSPQGLRMFQIDCPGPEDAIRDVTALRLEEGDRLWTDRGQWANLPTCFVEFGVRALEPGQAIRAEFTSTLLPAIGEVRALGAIRGISWPTSDPIPENDDARAFADSVQGIDGGWKSVPTVVPARDPAALGDPASGVEILGRDLARACGDLGWIPNRGICRSLEAKLDAADRALGRGRTSAARGSLRAFLNELDAQHGDQLGKRIDDAAYWLLRVNAERVLNRL